MTRRYLLDTGPAFDFLFLRRGIQSRIESTRSSGAKIGICTPVLGEIVGGLEGSSSRETSWAIVRQRLGKLICWPYDQPSAHEYGRIFAELRRRGRPMQQVDIQIAAIALTLGNCVVVTTDSDLSAISGLTVENWTPAEENPA
jgi:tRNA(fMet)-specific endonuclease VapC